MTECLSIRKISGQMDPKTYSDVRSYMKGLPKKKVVSVHIWQVHWPEPAEMIMRPRRQQKR